MPTFIDESGDTGSIESGGKPYFHLAAVWVPTLDDVEAFQEKARRLRSDLGLHKGYEFKFALTHSRPRDRSAFYECALSMQFRFAVASIDKTDSYWGSAGGPEQHWALSPSLRPYYDPRIARLKLKTNRVSENQSSWITTRTAGFSPL
jgi:hypothetical protein